MKKGRKIKGHIARAFPTSDGQMMASNANNTRASPPSDGFDKNKRSQFTYRIRMATWNLGSLTGRSQELAETLKRRNINICCIQETHWKGSKSRDLGLGYQLVYHGTNNKQNGVGVVLDNQLKDRIVNIERKSDRLIAVKLAMDSQSIMNIICAYAPQTGCREQEKDTFWDDLDEYVVNVPLGETKFIMGDLNGHVGKFNNTYEHIHGGFGYGGLNKEGERVLEFAARHNMSIINTTFQKKSEHLITYKSGGYKSQIDFILADDPLKKNFKDCKVIPGEPLTSQHRLLVGVYKLPKPLRPSIDKTVRIKWKELSGPKGKSLLEELRGYLTKDMENTYDSSETMWSNFEKTCKDSAGKILGISKGGLRNGKDPSWWDEEVKAKVQNKKNLFKTWQSSGLEEDHIKYKEAKSTAKKCVAQTRAKAREEFYSRLENAKSESEIFKVAKFRYKSTLDIKASKYIKDRDRNLLTNNEDINKRWYEYYKDLMNKEFPSQGLEPLAPVEGPVQAITRDEVQSAMDRMKNGKAVGPDEIPAEIWKSLRKLGVDWLTALFNLILYSNKIPNSWRLSHLIPFYKSKGDVTECGNYRGIKLTSHTLKIWERVMNNRIYHLTCMSPNQFGFTPSKSATDAIQAVRVVTEKHRLNKKDLHLIFIDLEKAFDRVPRRLVWQALRAQHLPDIYIKLVQDMYTDVRTRVKSPAGLTEEFEVGVGVHQGSALSPLLFNIVMDYVTKHIQAPLPWNLLYADDIVLMASSATELQTTLTTWMTALESAGLKVSRAKTEHLQCQFNSSSPATIYYPDRTPVPKINKFKYLGSVITDQGDVDADVAHRVNVAWLKWRSLTGVLCDARMPVRTKGKIYRTAVRPAMMYGAECWPVKKTHVQKLHTAEMKMLRWSGGVTRLDKVRNEHIRGSFKVAPISEKLTESRLRWYGHVMRRDEEHVVKKALQLSEHKRGRGRPPATWWTSMTKLLLEEKLPDPTTQDRLSWRQKIRRADPT